MKRNEIDILQNNLVHIRKVLNISTKDFSEMLGMTRQQINNLERGRSKMSKTLYIAVKCVVENFKSINEKISEDDYLIAQKLLTEKVIDFDYKKGLIFEESE